MTTALKLTSRSNEMLVQGRDVSLCLLIQERARALRVIDFRSGPHPQKLEAVLQQAEAHGLERVFTLVERDEVSTWTRLGLQREGSIPGFYKRSDAWILGAVVGDRNSEQSGIHPLSPQDSAEKRYQAARKVMKEREGAPRSPVKVQLAKAADVEKAVASAEQSGRALTDFSDFGRDVERSYYACTARGGFSLLVGVESQSCFDNAYLDLLTAPRTEKEARFVTSALGRLTDKLAQRDIVGCFSLTAVDDEELAVAFLLNGFRKTGLLRGHLLQRGQRQDAFLWSRKLAQPSDG